MRPRRLGFKELYEGFVESGANAKANDKDGRDVLEHRLQFDCEEMAECCVNVAPNPLQGLPK